MGGFIVGVINIIYIIVIIFTTLDWSLFKKLLKIFADWTTLVIGGVKSCPMRVPRFSTTGGWKFLFATNTSWRVGTIFLWTTIILAVNPSEATLNISALIDDSFRSTKNIGRWFFMIFFMNVCDLSHQETSLFYRYSCFSCLFWRM